jgi:hypothetical protein
VTDGGGSGSGKGKGKEEGHSPQVIEATLRIHGIGSKLLPHRSKKQQQQQHHGLRGMGMGSGKEERDTLAMFSPTPECGVAAQSVSHLYANGRIPQCECV